MPKLTSCPAISLLVCGLIIAPPAAAQSVAMPPVYLPLGAQADAPRGFVAMCEESAFLCQSDPSASVAPNADTANPEILAIDASREASRNALTPDISENPSPDPVSETMALPVLDMKQLRGVTRYVNVHVRQMSDARIYGKGEVWQRSGTGRAASGDCEDLALEKQWELRKLGYPPGSTMLAVVYRRSYGLHAVLVVRTQQGDYVLDNMTNSVKPWSRVKYSWLRIQSPDDPNKWRLPA